MDSSLSYLELLHGWLCLLAISSQAEEIGSLPQQAVMWQGSTSSKQQAASLMFLGPSCHAAAVCSTTIGGSSNQAALESSVAYLATQGRRKG